MNNIISSDPDLAPIIAGVAAVGVAATVAVRKYTQRKQLRAIYGPTAIFKGGVVLSPIKVPCDRIA
jgi:hypothetical protein